MQQMQETWVGRSPRVGNGNPGQYSCLEKIHKQRSLMGGSMGSQRFKSDRTEQARTFEVSTEGTPL